MLSSEVIFVKTTKTLLMYAVSLYFHHAYFDYFVLISFPAFSNQHPVKPRWSPRSNETVSDGCCRLFRVKTIVQMSHSQDLIRKTHGLQT
jgi:hypothetical protein